MIPAVLFILFGRTFAHLTAREKRSVVPSPTPTNRRHKDYRLFFPPLFPPLLLYSRARSERLDRHNAKPRVRRPGFFYWGAVFARCTCCTYGSKVHTMQEHNSYFPFIFSAALAAVAQALMYVNSMEKSKPFSWVEFGSAVALSGFIGLLIAPSRCTAAGPRSAIGAPRRGRAR